ncbi:MAG: branched-chain amino acid ABC transporter permease [Syntrophaceae bacterium]|nr:branched-chain amino acid ABC transporter permease [Syntrophaceae bacterium]
MILFQQLINGLMLGATYSLVAIGYTLIFGVLGLLHFAHGEVLMAGAFMGLYIILWSGMPLYITLPLAMVATGVLGIVIELLAIRPLKKGFHLAPLLSTIGVTIILQNLAVKLFGGYGTRFPEAIKVVHYKVGPLVISSVNILILGGCLFMMVVFYFFIAKTKTGKAMRAVSESHLTAGFLGVNVDRIVLITFGIASALAGAAGVMIGIAFHAITPFMGLTFALKGLVVMLLGGLGNVVGAMVGGLILGLAEVASIVILPTEINLQDIFSFGIMIIILIFKPEGLFGTRIGKG